MDQTQKPVALSSQLERKPLARAGRGQVSKANMRLKKRLNEKVCQAGKFNEADNQVH